MNTPENLMLGHGAGMIGTQRIHGHFEIAFGDGQGLGILALIHQRHDACIAQRQQVRVAGMQARRPVVGRGIRHRCRAIKLPGFVKKADFQLLDRHGQLHVGFQIP